MIFYQFMSHSKIPLQEIAKLFLKLGILGFGGPAAHIAMMHQEVVVKKQWMDEQTFLDLIGATHFIPGPNSTEMAIHIGYEKGGWKGLMVAGICFVLPAVLITTIIAFGYKLYGHLPVIQPFIYGIKPAIIAIVIGAVIPLAKKSFKNYTLIALAVLVLVGMLFFQLNEIVLLFGAGLLAIVWNAVKNKKVLHSFVPFAIFPLLQLSAIFQTTNGKLFWLMLKIGAILYGSGYVLFAFLDTALVQEGWISKTVLMDAIAVGQFTPGPVFSSVTFLGFQINGWSGALVATLGIFLPSFVFVVLLNPLVKKLRKSSTFALFLDAVNAASIALVVGVCYSMAKDSIMDWRTTLIMIISLIISIAFKKTNSALIVGLGAGLGYALSYL